MTIICNKCGERKELEEFPRDVSKKEGRSHSCKKCKNAQCKVWYKKNGDAKNKRKREDPILKEQATINKRKSVVKLTKEDPLYVRKNNLKKNFGMTIEDFEELLEEQDNRCGICGISREDNFRLNSRDLSVDHCHITGQVRGLLCHRCNSGLGFFKDSANLIEKALNYLCKN